MPNGTDGAAIRQIRRLFEQGTVSGLGEGQLLERFARLGDQAAFEALLSRHGPMVLAVCRGMLDPHEAEDAFQATFLVLVRRAGSIRDRDLIGPWLFGVAHRVARRMRVNAARKGARERPGPAELAALDGSDELDRREARQVLHEELRLLPEKYRDPVVLCHLEGLTHDEAARRLRWPVGTVRGRLSRARALLRERLVRRGVAPLVLGIAAALDREASASVPPRLFERTIEAAMGVAAGRAVAAGLASATAATLSQEVSRAMLWTKAKVAAALVVSLGLLATGAGVRAYQDARADRPGTTALNEVAPTAPAVTETRNPPVVDRPGAPTLPGATTIETPATVKVADDGLPQPTPAALPAQRGGGQPPALSTETPLLAAPAEPRREPPTAELPMVVAPVPAPPRTTGNVKSFLDRTKAEVDAAIVQVTEDVKRLSGELRQAESNLNRLMDLQRALGHTETAVPDAGLPLPAGPDLRSSPVPEAGRPIAPPQVDMDPRPGMPGRAAPPRESKPAPEAAETVVTGPAPEPGPNPGDGKAGIAPMRKVQPGDVLDIEVLQALPARPITGERLVRPDGTVSLGYYGDLSVAGLNREEIKVKLIEQLRKSIKDEILGLEEDAFIPDPNDPNKSKPIKKKVDPKDSDVVFVDDSPSFGAGSRERIEALEKKMDDLLRLLGRDGPKSREPRSAFHR